MKGETARRKRRWLWSVSFGDKSLRIYVYSRDVSKTELLEDVSRPGPRAGR